MIRLSKESKSRLDEVVLLCAGMLSKSRGNLLTLHFSRPEPFASFIAKYIPMNWILRDSLEPEDFSSYSREERQAIISSTIRRLVGRSKLMKERLSVPVLVGKGTPDKRIVKRDLVCYWPSTVLEELAQI